MTASATPELMPSTSGLAIGLRVSVCSSTPAQASMMPTAIALRLRGRRWSRISSPCQCQPQPSAPAVNPCDSTSSASSTARPSSGVRQEARRGDGADGGASRTKPCADLRWRSTRKIRNGAPRTPQSAPAGRSVPRKCPAILSRLSTTSSRPPAANDSANRAPIARTRNKWATLAPASPAKLMTPRRLTTCAVTPAASNNTSRRSSPTGAPRRRACSSSSASSVSGRYNSASASAAASDVHSSAVTVAQPSCKSEPAPQTMMPSNKSL